jgi:hypothetical protein
LASVQKFSVEQVIAASRSNKNGVIAKRSLAAAWAGMLFPPFCLFWGSYVLYSKGITSIGAFFYLFKDPSISPVRPILAAIAFIVWLVIYPKLALPAMFKSRTAIAYRDAKFLFYEREFDPSQVDHFERRVHGLLADLVIILKDGTEYSGSNSFVRGFPVP